MDTDTAQLEAAATLRSVAHMAGQLTAPVLRALLVQFMQAQRVPPLVAGAIAERLIDTLIAEMESATAPHIDTPQVRIDQAIALEK